MASKTPLIKPPTNDGKFTVGLGYMLKDEVAALPDGSARNLNKAVAAFAIPAGDGLVHSDRIREGLISFSVRRVNVFPLEES